MHCMALRDRTTMPNRTLHKLAMHNSIDHSSFVILPNLTNLDNIHRGSKDEMTGRNDNLEVGHQNAAECILIPGDCT